MAKREVSETKAYSESYVRLDFKNLYLLARERD